MRVWLPRVGLRAGLCRSGVEPPTGTIHPRGGRGTADRRQDKDSFRGDAFPDLELRTDIWRGWSFPPCAGRGFNPRPAQNRNYPPTRNIHPQLPNSENYSPKCDSCLLTLIQCPCGGGSFRSGVQPPTGTRSEVQPPTSAKSEGQPSTSAKSEGQPSTSAKSEGQPSTSAKSGGQPSTGSARLKTGSTQGRRMAL